MKKGKFKRIIIFVLTACLLASVWGCGSKSDGDSDSESEKEERSEVSTVRNTEEDGEQEENIPFKTESAAQSESETESVMQLESETEFEPEPESESSSAVVSIVQTELKPSQGLEFESNGDGTCTIIGIGDCTDTDLVIPEKSPTGDTVTLIEENAFMSLEDVESVTLVNCCYEVDKSAFNYSEICEVNIIGGSPIINKSAFANCEDLERINFSECSLTLDEYAFFCSGESADVSFTDCSGIIEKEAFEYGDILNLSISDCDFEIKSSAFANCESITAITMENSKIVTEDYVFFDSGDSAVVSMNDCELSFDDVVFNYASLSSLEISGSKLEAGESAFASCEDLTSVNIDCDYVSLEEYAFFSCDDLTEVNICADSMTGCEIFINDDAFQYCESLNRVNIGGGSVEIGEYVFHGCAEEIIIFVAGKSYKAEDLNDGIEI